MSRCTLELAANVIVVADGGPLEAEYALFDSGEIELQATGPGTNREAAYRTTARYARTRLSDLGITPTLAAQAAEALRPVCRSYARGHAVRCIVDRLGAAEFFEGQLFDPGTGLYRGAWLDLPALASDLGLEGGPALLQSLHLAALLTERNDDDPVALLTAELTAQRRPGERTFRRVTFESADALVPALRALGPGSPRPRTSSGPSRQQVVERLRARAERAPASRGLLPSLEAALSTTDQPQQGPLADPELWALELRLTQGETLGVLEEIEAIEHRHGRLPGTAYLRARAELWLRPEQPLELAERVSSLSTSLPAFHELELLAAQAWAAAGFVRRAKAFARDLMDNSAASDPLRLQARLVLEDLEGKTSGPPEPARGSPRGTPLNIPRAPRAPTGLGELPSERPAAITTANRSARPDPLPPSMSRANRPTEKAPPEATLTPIPAPAPAIRSAPPPTNRSGQAPPLVAPVIQSVQPASAVHAGQPFHPRQLVFEVEKIESLSLPAGLQGMPPPSLDEPPRIPPAARLAFTFLSRELGRDVRLRQGAELQTDLEGLEQAQRYLRERLPDGRVRTREEERELMRNGAFLSELLARRLGAFWVDLESNDSSRWAMLVPAGTPAEGAPPEPTRAWPFARVLRFIAMGHKERDLVSYYLELEARARRP
ncbi:MAG TPA: hypothetical protein VH044_01320 [Polyangiaceae bacterium]|nr:hypothetical protein [Polyangiaceae bacterium]